MEVFLWLCCLEIFHKVAREFSQDSNKISFVFSGSPLLLTRDYTTLAEALLISLGVKEDWTTQSFVSIQPIKSQDLQISTLYKFWLSCAKHT